MEWLPVSAIKIMINTYKSEAKFVMHTEGQYYKHMIDTPAHCRQQTKSAIRARLLQNCV